VLDQHPHGHLVRQPDIGPGEAAVGDLAAQHLDVLGDARGQPVAELGIALEPLKLTVRAGHLERGPGDLRGARQRCRGAGIGQPRPAPHQRHQEELGLGIQVQGQHRAVAVLLRLARLVCRSPRAPVPAWHRHRDLQPVVKHRARADHRRPGVHQPAAGRVPVALHPRQPDPVAIARHVERVGLADVGDPGAIRCRGDDPGPPGQAAPSGDRQVHLRTSPEYQLAAFGEPDDLARRGAHVRGHRISLGPGPRRGHPLIRG
jgi:hypothetical protein